jgi:predicted N-acetyltransferase YhbS
VSWQFTPLLPCDLAELAAYWRAAHPLHPLDDRLLAERLFAPETPASFDPELALAARDANGRLIGLTLGVFPLLKSPDLGGLRWLGVLPECVRSGLPEALAGEMALRLYQRGASGVRINTTPPFYLRPGIDTRETALITALLRAGWHHEATHFNLTCDLSAWQPPTPAQIFDPDEQGYLVRRATPADGPALAALIRLEFSEGWVHESALAFQHDPVSLFVAECAGELAGFAAYEVSQANGAFGPTGVLLEHRQARLGRRLLWACLEDLRHAGRATCEIGWVGPVPFYHDACGALLGPAYWCLRRDFAATPAAE